MRGALCFACGRIGNAEQQHERVVADSDFGSAGVREGITGLLPTSHLQVRDYRISLNTLVLSNGAED
jgi:hypothetical protein